MSFTIKLQESTGLWVVVAPDGKLISRAEDPGTAVNLANEKGANITAQEKQTLVQSADQQKAEYEKQNLSRSYSGPDPVVSSGATTTEAARANDDGANSAAPGAAPTVLAPTGRIETAPATTVPTNAEKFEPNTDTPPTATVTTVVNQSTPPAPNPATRGGNQTNEDATGAPNRATNATQAAIDKKFSTNPIVPRPNVLDEFASYSYTISIYLMSPDDFNRLLTKKQRIIPGYQLLMQSGGAPLQSGIVPPGNGINEDVTDPGFIPGQGPSLNQGRNQEFPLDFVIDSVKLTSKVSATPATRGSHQITELDFRIVEPYGITLFERLYKATQRYVTTQGGNSTTGGPENYAAQNYLMVIRFYGYDANGKLVLPQSRLEDPAGTSDRNAVVEKYIPFRFTGIKFRIANRLTEYECTGVSIQNDIGTGQARGVIPYNIELTATSLKNLLQGNVGYSSNYPPPKADAAPVPTLVTGLSDALNAYQQQLVDEGIYEYPDEYRFIIADDVIANAKIRPPGQTDLSSVKMGSTATAAQQKDGKKQRVDNNSKNVSATAGMQIVQFLDQVVRNSTYIYDQQTKIRDPKTNKEIPQGSAQVPAWYRIAVEAAPLKYDQKRNDYSYRITYQISMYKVTQIKSAYFPEGRFLGTHKKYDYWFTGENTSVLKYEQDFNYAFYLTVNSARDIPRQLATTNYQEYIKYVYSPNSAEPIQGSKGDTNEPGANGADYLYSPGDQAIVKLEIVGDPAWIQQGDLWSGLGGIGITDPNSLAFLPDGTINYESQEVLFEVGFNKPADYDLQTGLMKIKSV